MAEYVEADIRRRRSVVVTSHRQKVDRLIRDMRDRGISEYDAAPPIYRLLWKIGIKVRPPYFQPFFTIFLFQGLGFGLVFGGLMWLVLWRASGIPAGIAIIAALVAGLAFGLSMAFHFKQQARKLNLPSWRRY